MNVVAITRQEQGSSASRRLRHADKIPAIVYGGHAEPVAITLEHNPVYHALRVEAFHSSILDLSIDGKTEKVVLRNVQWHAFRQQVLHIDFQRVAANEAITMKVPLHFLNQESSPAVKLRSAVVSHVITEIEVHCLPQDLPEFIGVDLAGLTVEHPIHLSGIQLPKGVSAVAHGGDTDPVLAIATIPAGSKEDDAAAATEGDKK